MPSSTHHTVCKTAFLALPAMLMHALLPLAMALPQANGVMMTLCSAQGGRQIFVILGEQPAPPVDRDQATRPLCPLCVVGTQLVLPSIATEALLLRSELREARTSFAPRPAAHRTRHGPAQPRAPPQLSA